MSKAKIYILILVALFHLQTFGQSPTVVSFQSGGNGNGDTSRGNGPSQGAQISGSVRQEASVNAALINPAYANGADVLTAQQARDRLGNEASTAATALSVNNLAAAAAPLGMSFQHGIGGYTGSADVSINNQYGGNGITGRGTVVPVNWTTTYENKTLIAFNNLNLPAGARVKKATLEMSAICWKWGVTLTGAYLNTTWKESGNIGWLYRDTNLSWAGPGASGIGGDIKSRLSVAFPILKPSGEQRVVVALDPAVVHEMATNAGHSVSILMRNLTPLTSASILSYRNTVAAKRPKLVLEFESGAAPLIVDTTPPVVSLVSPSEGAQISGSLQADALASDGSGLEWVEFQLDGVPLGGRITATPYRLILNTLSWPNGAHTLAAKARDKAGNEALSAATNLVVSNLSTAPSLFAPPMLTGQVDVKLVPTSAVVTGRPVLVTFGLPLPRGSMAPSELNRIRVLEGTAETAAFVEMLTPWRHARDVAIDQRSVRVARIQIWHTFRGTAPETVKVSWDSTPRMLSEPSLMDPRNGWHLVQDGGFLAGDGVYEPDVYAVLPASHLAKGVLTLAQAQPFDPSVTEPRSDPALMASAQWTGFTGFQQAEKNSFFTIINQDDTRVSAANSNPFKTDYEPWLFDRATAMYQLYFQSGFYSALRQAVRNSQFYAAKLYPDSVVPAVAAGLFRLKMPVPADWGGGNTSMYSYNESLAYTYWLMGDDTLAPVISRVAKAHRANTEPIRWSPALGSWTERHAAYWLLAETVLYEVSGDDTAKNNMLGGLADLAWHQDGAGGQLPGTRLDGGLYHKASQHAEAGGNTLLASPWMSAILMKPVVRAHGLSGDNGTAQFVIRMARFLKSSSRVDAGHSYSSMLPGPFRYPDYLVNVNGTSNTRDAGDVEHTLDVLAGVAWGYFFTTQIGTPDADLRSAAMELYRASEAGFKYWTRPAGPASGLPAFRVAPWRKYNWQFSGAGSVTWLLR